MSGFQAFDPTRYLTKVSGRDYLTVQWRLVWLRSEHPLAQIETELVKIWEDGALFRATVTLPPAAVRAADPETGEITPTAWSASATGYGSETTRDFADYIEKAETKAVGRALAALGFGTQFAGLDDAALVPDAPVSRQSPARPGPSQPPPPARQGVTVTPIGNAPTERQFKYVHALKREHHWPDQAFTGYLVSTFGVESMTDLDRRQVSQVVEYLNSAGEYVDPRQRQLPVGAGPDNPPLPDDLPEPDFPDDPWNDER